MRIDTVFTFNIMAPPRDSNGKHSSELGEDIVQNTIVLTREQAALLRDELNAILGGTGTPTLSYPPGVRERATTPFGKDE